MSNLRLDAREARGNPLPPYFAVQRAAESVGEKSSRGAKPKNFHSFLVRLPPDPPPQGGKGKEGNFWLCCRRLNY